MKIRQIVLDALAKGPQTFPELHSSIGGRRQAIMQVLILAKASGHITREGTRRKYIYSISQSKESKPIDLTSIWYSNSQGHYHGHRN